MVTVAGYRMICLVLPTTDRPKSFHKFYVIENFGDFLKLLGYYFQRSLLGKAVISLTCVYFEQKKRNLLMLMI